MTQKVMAKYFSKKEGRIPNEVAQLEVGSFGRARRAPGAWLLGQGLAGGSEDGR